MKSSRFRRIWRSACHCGLLSSGLLIGGAFSPIQNAGANFSYSGIDHRCVGTIDRSVSIGQVDAANLAAMPEFTTTRQAGIGGWGIYCSIGRKAITTSKGVMWGTAYIVPIAQTDSVLVVTVDEFTQILKVEYWGVGAASVRDRALNYYPRRMRPDSPASWMYERIYGQPPEQPEIPRQPVGNAPDGQPIPETRVRCE